MTTVTFPTLPSTPVDFKMPVSGASTNAAFFSQRGVRILRVAMGLMSRAAPNATARLVRRWTAMPPRHRRPGWEQQCMKHTVKYPMAVCGRTLQVIEWGKGDRVVLLVHSWGGRGTQLGKFVQPFLEQGFRVVTFDLPAHGDSEGREVDMVDAAFAIGAVMQSQPHLHMVIAHSFGVMATLLAAHECGVHIPKLVSISAFKSCRWFIDVVRDHLGITERVAQQVRDDFERRHNYTVTWERLSVVELLRAAKCPTLLIHDRFDREVPFAHAEALADALEKPQLFPTAGLGHRRILKDQTVISAALAFAHSH
jgi:pimeloyl-ACP methyl ester carboxylesterase